MNENTLIAELADKVLQDRVLIQKLSDKVYELMLNDLQIQRDRTRNYKR